MKLSSDEWQKYAMSSCSVAARSRTGDERTALTEATMTILGEGGVIGNVLPKIA